MYKLISKWQVAHLKWHNHNKAVQDDDEEIRVHVRVKIRPGEMESAVHANAPVDASPAHALAIADAQTPAAQESASLVGMVVGVRYTNYK